MKYKPFFSFLIALFVTFSSFAQGEQAEVAKEGLTAGATAPAAGDAAVISAGETLFKNNCASCHALDEEVVGPALRGINKKRSEGWLVNWIRNSSKMVQAGDKDAVAIFNQYNKQQMPSFAMSDDEIKSMLAYIQAAPQGSTEPTPVPGETSETASAGAGEAGKYLDILLIILVVVLIVMVITLLIIASVLSNYLKKNRQLSAEDEEVLNQRVDFGKILKSKVVRGLALTIFVVAILDLSLDAALGVGIQQNYQPKQPIAFSHKLHAGDHKIDCNYCHTSAYKSKNANIPSANICMNCHSQIKKESAEIQKIYTAIEKKRPIEWVRIHNLPELAYFNHSQHTQVGGIECQTCHGPIETMEVVYQYSPLTMGWCINCHRETPLNTQGNGYYDNLVKLHEGQNAGAPFTVVSNGGAECSKCHY
ncbi:MAG TPA: cytochrome c3 family protein [Adhaeribacter sp.]|nr:cytochrome c3 family protein [Adhaeribacter sp.]